MDILIGIAVIIGAVLLIVLFSNTHPGGPPAEDPDQPKE